MSKTQVVAGIIILSALFLILFKTSTVDIKSETLAPNATILAFGDSLTYGYGAVDAAYPLALERLTNRRVINAGISGEVSAVGLQRFSKLLDKHYPSLVILCHGGNDILRRQSHDVLKENLRKMIRLSKERGVQVLLVGVPGFGIFGANILPLYKELSVEESVMYEGDILEKIENDASLKSDQIHPNAQGYKMMAEYFNTVLKEHGVI